MLTGKVWITPGFCAWHSTILHFLHFLPRLFASENRGMLLIPGFRRLYTLVSSAISGTEFAAAQSPCWRPSLMLLSSSGILRTFLRCSVATPHPVLAILRPPLLVGDCFMVRSKTAYVAANHHWQSYRYLPPAPRSLCSSSSSAHVIYILLTLKCRHQNS